ncbi:SDR family oxidoreductase [Spongiactinospora sp. TRM90649]|uniref:SDR family oxidoreductase n=1 Tax=Spongiactinospora sp. TRM90649 TaxID=3031114 RepID=UPI0023F7F485|nr:SDR family oxidoreductase [Spongiactinospora sp. TRM90649]MDF5752675.1 SDR family oxidoreductase [Spongiactinospora sp. TRM90649]
MIERPRALVTGASRGVGAAVAALLAPTHDVLLGGRDTAELEKVASGLDGARPWPVELTAVTEADVAGIDRLDVLVHSAGVLRVGRVADAPARDWRESMEVNLFAVAELTRLLIPALRAARGHVVVINSGAGQRANAEWGPYAASKFAVRAFADALRLEEHGAGIRVTSVFPGRVDTGMQRSLREIEGGPYEREKYLTAESVARAVMAAVAAPPDAHLTEISVRPTAGNPS